MEPQNTFHDSRDSRGKYTNPLFKMFTLPSIKEWVERKGKLEEFEELMESEENNETLQEGISQAQWAGLESIVDFTISVKTAEQLEEFFQIIRTKKPEKVKEFIMASKENDPQTRFLEIIPSASVEEIKSFIQTGFVDINDYKNYLSYPLKVASWDFKKMQTLIEAGANSAQIDRLFADAVLDEDCAHLKGLKFLIDHGADVNAPIIIENKITTALHENISGGMVEIAELLLENGADCEKTNSEGKTALQQAISLGKNKGVQLLIEYGASVRGIFSESKELKILLNTGAVTDTIILGQSPLALIEETYPSGLDTSLIEEIIVARIGSIIRKEIDSFKFKGVGYYIRNITKALEFIPKTNPIDALRLLECIKVSFKEAIEDKYIGFEIFFNSYKTQGLPEGFESIKAYAAFMKEAYQDGWILEKTHDAILPNIKKTISDFEYDFDQLIEIILSSLLGINTYHNLSEKYEKLCTMFREEILDPAKEGQDLTQLEAMQHHFNSLVKREEKKGERASYDQLWNKFIEEAITKGIILPTEISDFKALKDCLTLTGLKIDHVSVKKYILFSSLFLGGKDNLNSLLKHYSEDVFKILHQPQFDLNDNYYILVKLLQNVILPGEIKEGIKEELYELMDSSPYLFEETKEALEIPVLGSE